ncbi:Phosphatidylinositol N-acetyglucosaminlytransferase subunit P-like protein [Melia azedarach]|uniref:Phosphatidylinositol N-acetyglucosaminlytransferase subunit P-like protein n=1 Tax=Melia azedarach TaxID=155640 RepID=A0ACC1YWV9_MELAZ|nr:Phosphatidylinositol N-acetyglucosaminlytransferase subunit P-like protein [Melia azedarach]
MAKRSLRRPVRYEKDQLGCMWGFISIFDFRHGRFTQKLLSDRRRSSRYAAGDGNAINKLGTLTWLDVNEGTFDDEESKTPAADTGKPSVKKLMEEEMINEQDTKKEINNAEVEPKHSHKEQGSPRKKTGKRMKKARKKSCDSIDLDAPENLRAEQQCHQNSEHQSTGSLDIDNVMEEFCHQIHQKSISYMEHEQAGDLDVQSNQKNPVLEEKLREAIKLLISQKLIKGKHLSEDGEIHPSTEQLADALQILGSDAEVFVKHLQDPNSLLVKCIQNFPDTQLEKDEDSMSLAGSNLSEQELGNLRRSDDLVNHKHRKFFRRKVKSQERSPSNGEKTSQASNRIVILKPGPTGLQNPEIESAIGSSPEAHYVMRNKVPNERIGSHPFLSEIKRKLKYAMGKEHHANGIQKRLSYDCQNLGDRDRGIKENVGMNSPTKDHFFIEKIARPVGVKKADKNKTGKLKDSELGTEFETADLSKQRVSNIYLEAKKHLSEILSTGDENVDSSSGRVPKTLGRILSLPEYNSSPVGSPGRNWENGFVTAQMRYVDSDKFHQVNENTSSPKQDSHVSHLGETIKGDVEIVKTNEIVVEEESSVLDAPCEPSCFSSIDDDEQNEDESVICNGQKDSNMKEDLGSSEDNQLPCSPLASPSNTLVTKKLEDQETAIDVLERPSPVSVLEPLFVEDDISPASTRCHTVQPLQIQFEEHASSAAVQNIQMKSSVEDKESMFEYVKAVLQVSDLNWDELCVKSLSTDQLLDPSLFDEVEFSPDKLCYEQKLLFDLINEVLLEICGHYFGCLPWVSFVKSHIRPVPNKENALSDVWEGVLWHLIPLPLPHTLEQTVRKDMAKSGTWMDLRFDADNVGIEMGDAILEELMEDTILSCVNENPESEYALPLDKLKESESSTNSESGWTS